ncbi:MAG: hypothetical protein IKV10_00530 [Alphaproteobacteria bacterium]|nr:hypothetical protein [Alphaproteobacteria bacterium]
METIETLKRKLKQAEASDKDMTDVKYPTNIIIDLSSYQGNVFFITGMARHVLHQLSADDSEYEEYKKECENKCYKEILEISRRWFGFIYINGDSICQK